MLNTSIHRQPFRVIRGMDYMYNQQQTKAMKMAQDGWGLGDLERMEHGEPWMGVSCG